MILCAAAPDLVPTKVKSKITQGLCISVTKENHKQHSSQHNTIHAYDYFVDQILTINVSDLICEPECLVKYQPCVASADTVSLIQYDMHHVVKDRGLGMFLGLSNTHRIVNID